jgi:hypothetical protein
MICARGLILAGLSFQEVNMGQNRVGRPPTLSADDKDLLLEYIAAGMSNRKACHEMRIETSTFYLALHREPEFMERYHAAKASAVEALVDDGEDAAERAELAESGAKVAGLKVRADYKFRMASRLAPQRWGEKASVHVTGAVITDETEMAKRVAFLEALDRKGPGSAEPDADDEEESLV